MSQNAKARSMRWWIPLCVVALAVGIALYLPSSDVAFREPLLLGVGLLTVLLLGVWYIFFTGLAWRTRWLLVLVSAGGLAGICFGVAQWTRIEGSIGGSGIPRLVWKWSAKPEGAGTPLGLASPPSSGAQAAEKAPLPKGDFAQFLGSDRSGILSGVALERNWDRSPPKTLWRQPIGLGWSAFAVSGRHAITQEQRREDELIVCYDTGTGRAVWAHTNRVRFSETLGGDGPRATPTIHSGRVYTMGGCGNLDCLEEETGQLIWSRDVLTENQLSNVSWGKSCSPLLVKELVVVTGGEQRQKTLLAYEAATGKAVWSSGHDRASYCSPVVATLSEQEQIIMVNGHSVTGHDPLKGNILWEYSWPDDFAKATQPLVIDTNRVLIAAGYGVGCVMLKVEPSRSGWCAAPLWKNRSMKPKFTNLVRRGQYVYGLDEGVLTCVDLERGSRVWRDRRYGHGQILLVDDLLLIQAESGDVALVEVSAQQAREKARFPALHGKTWNNPALVNDLLLVRNDHEAACYRLPLAASPAPD